MNFKNKIVPLGSLRRKVSLLRRQKKKIAFTNGCFDILHRGHVDYLLKAKKKDRVLIVAVNSDRSVRAIKGKNRPIVSENDRALIIASLEFVDYVLIFNEPTPYRVISLLKPDVLIKGSDWKTQGAVGAEVVRKNKGRVEYIPLLKGYSTTGLIEKILKSAKN